MRIVFLHMPKTAGVAVRNALIEGNPQLSPLPATGLFEITGFSIADLECYDLIAGHFDWSFLDALEGPTFTFTILREPLERIVSLYVFQRSVADDYVARGIPLDPLLTEIHSAGSLAEALAGPVARTEYDNLYAHYFAGRAYYAVQRFEAAGIPSSRVLELAREHLCRLDLVLTLENLERGLARLEERTGLAVLSELKVENETLGKDGRSAAELLTELDPDGAARADLDRFTRLDRELYADAVGEEARAA